MQFLLGQCHNAFVQYPSILLTLFLAGLVGGMTHCAGMCGPFVMAQVKCSGGSNTKLEKLSGAALLPYHMGRMTTYILLGVVAASLSQQIIGTPLQRWVSVSFLIIAGFIFILSALPHAKKYIIKARFNGFAHIGNVIGKLARPLSQKSNSGKGYALGVLLGFLPCGLIFASLMVVSTTGNAVTAALAMALFTIGTIPALFMVGLGSNFAYKKWPNITQNVARGVMVFNGISLFLLAGNIVL